MTDLAILSVKLETLHGDVVEVKTALEKLSDAITKLALVEQRQTQIAEALERAFKAIGKIEERMTALEQAAPKSKETSKWVDWFIMTLVAAVLMFVSSKLGVMK